MTTTTGAIYEHGVLRPLSPLPLVEGARVEVTVTDTGVKAPSRTTPTTPTAGGLLREVASLPMESGEVQGSGRDHDRFLYGGRR